MEVCHLVNDDEENLFALAFRTAPAKSDGAPHILEHSVLCGSEGYPLKDPFIRLVNQSVKTFLNALTFPDKTVYPASSMVEKDYFNLFAVYADAVFFPRLEKWTFLQEGHRLELDSQGKPVIQGVVYNEMKGSYSSFDAVAGDAAVRSLFPESVYALDSGGDPLSIPALTYGDFITFHRTHYRPSNCILFLYGNIPTERQLGFIQERVLCRFGSSQGEAAPEPAYDPAPYTRPAAFEEGGPAPEEPEGDAGCTVLVNWLLGDTFDSRACMEGVFLNELLLGHDASPLTRALIDSGLGEDLAPSSGLETEFKRLVFQTGLRGVKREDAPRVEQCVMDTLRGLLERPVPREDIEGACMSVDFSYREVKRSQGPYSLTLMRRVLRCWVYGKPPWDCLSPRSAFAQVKERIKDDGGYIQALIKDLLLGNPHRTLVTVYPDPGYNEARRRAEEALAQGLLSRTTADLVKRETQALNRLQETPDDGAKAACLPHLLPSDLTVKIDRIVTTQEKGPGGVPLFRNTESTNGIVYVIAAFPLDALAPEDLPLLPFFTTALSNTGFGGRPWDECAKKIALTMGGFNATPFTSSPIRGSASPYAGRPWLFVQIKTLAEKTGEALDLLSECLLSSEFAEPRRISDLLFESRNDVRGSVIPMGHDYAMLRAGRSFNLSRALEEVWNGLTQLFALQDFLSQDPEALGARLGRLRRSLLGAGAAVHVTTDDFSLAEGPLERFITRTGLKPPSSPGKMDRDAVLALTALGGAPAGEESAVEYCAAPAQVGFAAAACEASEYGSPESVHEKVFSHWFSNTLLWEHIRTQGGAYGAFAFTDSVEGLFSLSTFRDPKPEVSLGAFLSCLQRAGGADFSRETVERALSGAYSKEVQPRSPSGRGFIGFVRALCGITNEMREEKIARILAIQGKDMGDAAERLYASAQRRLTRVMVGSARETGGERKIILPF
jgi:Zn-dependent M16 (insulinase) family peptidase